MKPILRPARAALFLAALAFPPLLHAVDRVYAVPPPPAGIGPRAVTTFACIGLYWAPPGGAAGLACAVHYRVAGGDAWSEAMPLWFDDRNREYRGSIVGLKSGTSYEISLKLGTAVPTTSLTATTWPEKFPIAKTVTLPAGTLSQGYVITEGGTAQGYVLYTAAPGGTTIDVAGGSDQCVTVRASCVMVRGLVLKNARVHGLHVEGLQRDVVIEKCDISGWGRIDSDGFGKNCDAGILADDKGLRRLIVQRNRIHDPRSNANDWRQPRPGQHMNFAAHPSGPQGVILYNPEGNNVIRYNEVYSDENHRFNDGLGGGDNFSFKGYPGADSDMYGNIVRNSADDAMEIEGGGCNVRIWGNYVDWTFSGISSASCSIGPLYIFRNIMGVSRYHFGSLDVSDNRGIFAKIGDDKGRGGLTFGRGRRYLFHNTVLQPPAPAGSTIKTLGAAQGACDIAGPMTNTVSRNNIWDVTPGIVQAEWHNRPSMSVSEHAPGNDLDYDLCSGPIIATPDQEAHAIRATPVYAPDNGPTGGSQGPHALDPASPGFDQAVRIPNFNDQFTGQGPDMGAQEAGLPPLQFGVQAYESSGSP